MQRVDIVELSNFKSRARNDGSVFGIACILLLGKSVDEAAPAVFLTVSATVYLIAFTRAVQTTLNCNTCVFRSLAIQGLS